MTAAVPEPVADELELLRRIVPLAGARVALMLKSLHHVPAARLDADRGVLQAVEERHFETPIAFRDFDDFVERMVRVTHTDLAVEGALLAEVRRRFSSHMGPGGARFLRPMRVNLLRRPAP